MFHNLGYKSQNLREVKHPQHINLQSVCQASGFYGQVPYMPDTNEIVLGEFWVDLDREVFIDIDDPIKSLQDLSHFQTIKKLQKKGSLQSPPINPFPFRNRPRQAQRKSKGY